MKFYYCEHCKNIITFVNEKCHGLDCCGTPMKELIPSSTDAAVEKHVPVVEVKENLVTVTVGSVKHPMLDTHLIEWIIVETNKGVYKKNLKPNEEPIAKFVLDNDEKVVHVYEYCNLHGLWEA